ncbi:MAG: hypothetical protein ACXWCG_09890 [Flavitalea sp.]
MKKLSGLFITLAILIFSCEPERSYVAKETDVNNTVTDFHAKQRKEQQIFSVDASNSGVISAFQGARLFLPPNGFVTLNGSPVSGNIQVSVKEIYTPMEMIFNNMPTTSNGRLLESGGEFEIVVSQNNTPLKLAAGNFVKIGIPNKGINLQGMQVFKGVVDASGKVDWVVNSNPGNLVVGDSLLFSNTNLFSDEVNWINVDKFINDPTVEFTVYPGNFPSGDSTNVFVHLTGRNTVVKMDWVQGLSFFKSDMLLAVPSTIVGISTKNGQLFASVTPVNIQGGSSVTMNFLPYSEQQLKDRLSKLR